MQCLTWLLLFALAVFVMVSLLRWFEQTADAVDQREWGKLLEGIAGEAQQRGELRDDIDLAQLVFDVTAPVQLANYYYVLRRDGTVLDQARASIRNAIAAAKPIGDAP